MKSLAEFQFREYVRNAFPELTVTKKGLPDFMIIKGKRVVGFVEVKESLPDNLRKEQVLFRDFCKRHDIPYQVWRPEMGRERWLKQIPLSKRIPERIYERYRRLLAWGDEIWEKF